jgi:ornithine carbamoyltransferase
MRRHLISLQQLGQPDLSWIIQRASQHASGSDTSRKLVGTSVGTYFALTSTRTRTSFTIGALSLGANVITYGPKDLQVNTGETIIDTCAVLSRMLDAFVMRTPDSNKQMESLTFQSDMAIINAMSFDEHPTQALADLTTMYRQFGRIDGLRVLYVGEGNSTAAALCLAMAKYPQAQVHFRTPIDYGLPAFVLEAIRQNDYPGSVAERHDMNELPPVVDIVYTTRWQTTGTSKRHDDWRRRFAPFKVTASLMDRFPLAVFMHDLPAHRGDEVDASVIDGVRSIVYEQAENKLYSAMGALEWCIGS